MVVFALVVASGGYVYMQKAFASTNGILDTRSITMSTSASAATNVIYTVKFNIGTTGNVGGVAIVFCVEDPIPGDTCTVPTSMNVNRTTTTVASQTGFSGFSVSATGATNQINIVNATPQSMTQGQSVSLTLGTGSAGNGITNPTYATNTAFYARILTYTTSAGATGSSPTSPGTYVDAGGIALYITAQLTITSKVEEQLSLCIYTGANCAAGGTSILLGDSNDLLSTAHAYVNINGKFAASTNAASGMSIFAGGTTLTSPQGNTIAAIGSSSASSNAGSEQFGFCVATSGGTISAASPYNDANCSTATGGVDGYGTAKFAYDVTSSPNMTSVGGMKIASSTNPSTTTTGTLAYIANIAVTTKAGIYSTTQTFVGIGTF